MMWDTVSNIRHAFTYSVNNNWTLNSNINCFTHKVREFHRHLPSLVRPGGMYSFFNGIADNVFFLGVACECIKIELTQMGFSQIDFYPVDIDVSDAEIWKDTSFRYFNSNQYYLPVCLMGDGEAQH